MTESINLVRRWIDDSCFVNNFNLDDVRRAKSQDWWIADFLKFEKHEENAAMRFIECLRWRERFGVQSIGAVELSDALAENFIYFHGCDLDGRNILWLNWTRYQFIPTRRTAERLLVYWLERHCMETQNTPFTLIVNFHGCDMRDVDFEFVRFLFACLFEYYPCSAARGLLYDAPHVMWNMWREVDSNTRLRQLSVDRTSIGDYVPFKFLPTCMGGEDDYVFVMQNLPNCIYSRSSEKLFDNLNGEIINENSSLLAFQPLLEENAGNLKKSVKFKEESLSVPYVNDDTTKVGSTLASKCSALENVRGENGEESDLLLGVSEKNSLVLKRSSRGEYITQLTLENRSRGNSQIFFKVKTTAPQKFRVRPTLGVIPTGKCQTIHILLDRAYEKSYYMERFLISTVLIANAVSIRREKIASENGESGDEAPRDFEKLMETAHPTDTFQIKLNCTMEPIAVSADDRSKVSLDGSIGTAADDSSLLTSGNFDEDSIPKSLDHELALFLAERELSILNQVNAVRQHLNINRVLIVVIVLIQVIMFLYFIKVAKNGDIIAQ